MIAVLWLIIISLSLVLGLLTAIFIIILKSSLTIALSAYAEPGQLNARFSLFLRRKKIYHSTIHEPSFQQQPDRQPDFFRSETEPYLPEGWRNLLKQIQTALKWLQNADSIQVKHFSWVTSLGTGEADKTALLCGAIWTIKWALISKLDFLSSAHPHIQVRPLFRAEKLSTRLSCIISFKVGEAILMMRWIRRELKEGERNGRTSDTGTDENRTGQPPVNDRCRDDCR